MKKILKNQKGINLISLTLAVMIILILTGIVLYNVKGNLSMQRLRNMQVDIENLQDKVSTYYSNYGDIPAKIKYTNISAIETAGLIGVMDDEEEFYVLDLSALENVTLNYGEDYKKITEGMSQSDVDELDNLYIINKDTHNIFLAGGVRVDGKMYYTNYTEDKVDKDVINIHNVQD